MPMISFYTPWKREKTRGILMFSGGGVYKVTSGMKGLISSFSRYSWSRDPILQLQKQSPEVFDQKADLKILQYS